jgi:hypothetical protein
MTRAGLPVGVQIVGPLYGDRITLAVARMLDKSWRFPPAAGLRRVSSRDRRAAGPQRRTRSASNFATSLSPPSASVAVSR